MVVQFPPIQPQPEPIIQPAYATPLLPQSRVWGLRHDPSGCPPAAAVEDVGGRDGIGCEDGIRRWRWWGRQKQSRQIRINVIELHKDTGES